MCMVFLLVCSLLDLIPCVILIRPRSADLNMGAIFNARERSVAEWKALITEADARFQLKQVIQPKGSALAIMEVRWDGNADAGV